MSDIQELVLKHFGVKGMKWGVTRSRGSNGRVTDVSEDAASAISTSSKIKVGGLKAVSNKELSDLNNRIGLEQRYAQLNPPSKSKAAVIGKFIKKHAADRINDAARVVTTQELEKLLAKQGYKPPKKKK